MNNIEYTRGEARTFQMALLGVFAFFVLAGVIAFATFRGGDSETLPPIEIWGTIPQETFDNFLGTVNIELDQQLQGVSYRGFTREQFDTALVEALASGRGPDMILVPQDLLVRHYDRIYVLPFESFDARTFRDRFIEEGELVLNGSGIVAFPFSIDPLVLYWNRTLFANEGIAQPPAYWDELAGLSGSLTKRDARGNVTQSVIAFGEFANVTNAKEIITTLIMQAGGAITQGTPGNYTVTLQDSFNLPEAPALSTLRFYTEFANPARTLYSWNRSLPLSEQAFLAGDVALYPGFASELYTLRQKNPNLNYDIAMLPQVRDATEEITFGRMYALAAMRQSPNVGAIFNAIGLLTTPGVLSIWENETGLPPVRRDMLAREPSDAFRSVFYDSALIAEGFLDPDPRETANIFQTMVEDVTSGRSNMNTAVREADERMSRLIQSR